MTPFFARLKFAFRTFFAILFHDRVPSDVASALVTRSSLDTASRDTAPRAPVDTAPRAPTQASAVAPPRVTVSERTEGTATQLLALLQRDGRLVDFLMEDIAPYADAQIGSAVRTVHAGCRQALHQYVSLAPALDAQEGERVTVDASTIEAAKVKLLGNVTGNAPFAGVLRHRGWIVDRLELPPLPVTGLFVVAPAEVEML